MWLSVILLAAAAATSRAVIFLNLYDPVDDSALVSAVSGQKPVKEFAAQIEALENILLAKDKEEIEKLLGKPAAKQAKDYAMPVAQSRKFVISGLRQRDEHHAFYPVGDFAGIEVHYANTTKPEFTVLYFKVDGTFPKLKEVEEKGGNKPAKPPQPPAVLRKTTIDVDHWEKMKHGMNKDEIAKLFSAPAGDYAPGTDYLTRSWGWRRGRDGKVHETLEWRSEKGRIVVDFDKEGNYLTSEFYRPGRDPVTNVAERLKWDREKFDKVKKYVEKRLAEK
jgi:hypothetical protein